MSMPPRIIRSALVRGCPRGARRTWEAGRVPILVGGTGLYFKALTQGLSAVPPTPPEIRAAVRARCDAAGRGGAACRACPPRSGDGGAAQARRPDADRPRAGGAGGDRTVARRLAPRRHAGDARSGRAVKIFLDVGPGRAVSPDRCPLRCHAGGRRAGRGEGARRPRPRSDAARHEGPRRALAAAAPGGRDQPAEAAEGGKKDTRRYTKRQVTWFRHQMPGWTWLAPGEPRRRFWRVISA